MNERRGTSTRTTGCASITWERRGHHGNILRFHTITSITQGPYLYKCYKKIYPLLRAYIWLYVPHENR